jgi:ketosteroid isomerase-like protein
MERADVDGWLADYVEAWKTYDAERIGALFSDDAEYRYHPYDEPVRGREAIVEAWLGEGEHADASDRDDPGTYEAAYSVIAVDGDTRSRRGPAPIAAALTARSATPTTTAS